MEADYSQLTFRKAYRQLASRFPSLRISYQYAAKRADEHIHANLLMKAAEVKETAIQLFQDAAVDVDFLGSRRLLELARRRPKTSYELKVSKNLSADSGYIVLTSLGDYNRFLRDSTGRVRAGLFESNVRDFQGNTEVNYEIEKTLSSEFEVDFGWMNNGVTIIGNKATLNGYFVIIESRRL